MLYTDFKAGDKEYKLRLNTRAVVMLEKTLGGNPLSIFGEDGEVFPTVTQMVAILHASLQAYNHSISIEDAYDIFDAYLADGNAQTDFIQVILEVYKISGIIPEVEEAEKN